MRICSMVHDTPCCASALLKVSSVTGVSTGPASVNRHLMPCLAASVQLIAMILDCAPGSAISSRKPLPFLQTTSEYSDCLDTLRPNICTLATSQFAPEFAAISDATSAYTSLFSGSLQ